MHEYPVTEEIVRIAGSHANAGERVKAIRLVVGDYSGYLAECIRLYFDIIAEGTVCEGAELIVRRVEPMLRCEKCDALFKRQPLSFQCPHCDGQGLPTEIGREFYIEEITTERIERKAVQA